MTDSTNKRSKSAEGIEIPDGRTSPASGWDSYEQKFDYYKRHGGTVQDYGVWAGQGYPYIPGDEDPGTVDVQQEKNLFDLFPITDGYPIEVVLEELRERIAYTSGSPMGVGDHRVRKIVGHAGPIYSEHIYDEHGKPAGGYTAGVGFVIAWQNGPLGRGEDRLEANGAFVQDTNHATIDRLEWYEEGEFACMENNATIVNLKLADTWMQMRRDNRARRGVEGTHQT